MVIAVMIVMVAIMMIVFGPLEVLGHEVRQVVVVEGEDKPWFGLSALPSG